MADGEAVADSGTQRWSPLAGMADELRSASAASGGALRLVEIPFLGQVNLRVEPKERVADAVGLALDAPLPTEPNTTVTAGDLSVLWLGPDEWLVIGPAGSGPLLERRLRVAVAGEVASVVDVSAQLTTLVVAGARATDLLAHGCSLDLHPRAFGVGRCAQTMLARAQVVLIAGDPVAEGGRPDEPVYRVLVRASFARYLAEWLLDAATEYVPFSSG